MADIALFVPFEDMLAKAKQVIRENQFSIALLKHIETYNAVEEARQAAQAGIGIIVARGRQARLIKKYTNLPLVEIRFLPQEIGLMILQAKKLVGMEHPHIGLIVYENMLCDMSHMEELFQVQLSVSLIESAADAPGKAAELKKKGADIVIGGEIACQAAGDAGLPSLLYESTELSIRQALATAEQMAFVQDSEKQNSAQFDAILDTAGSGIIKISPSGAILLLNRRMESLLGKRQADVAGQPVSAVIPQVEEEAVLSILNGTRESYASSVSLQNRSWVLVISPIQYDHHVSGAILAFHTTESVRYKPLSSVLGGYSASFTFEQFRTESPEMKEALSQARMYAISDRPVLIYGPEGTEYYPVAEAIHNNSSRRSGPFVSVNLNGLNEQQQSAIILGTDSGTPKGKESLRSALIKAHYGTLLLIGAEHLCPWVQHELLHFLQSAQTSRTETPEIERPDIRIIAVAQHSLRGLLADGRFNSELYYSLQGLTVSIPPLSKRKEDLILCFQDYVQSYSRKYNRYFKISDRALKKLTEYGWEGNLLQLEAFTERLILTTQKRMIDEPQIDSLYLRLYPKALGNGVSEQVVVYQSPEAAHIKELMRQHHGNRARIAQELGVSTTTLWRRLKKYGITQ